jgi:hypothetical protein
MRKTTSGLVVMVLAAALGGCAEYSKVASSTLEGMAQPRVGAGGTSGDVAARGSTAPVTYRNESRRFQFTIPAGWALTDGDPNSDSAVFRKGATSSHFQFHYTQMASDFPAETSVQVSLKSALEEVKQGKNLSAKRRNEKCTHDPKKLCARGWELVDNGERGPQRIIWQAYDMNNFYFNFMASAENTEFGTARGELQGIIDSIHFGD